MFRKRLTTEKVVIFLENFSRTKLTAIIWTFQVLSKQPSALQRWIAIRAQFIITLKQLFQLQKLLAKKYPHKIS